MRIRLPRPVKSSLIEPGVVPVYCAVLCAALFIGLAVALTDFTYDAAALNSAVVFLTVAALAGASLNRYGHRIGSGMEALALFSALSLAAPLCAVILASTAYPLTDALWTDIDRHLFLGFERNAVVEPVITRPMLMEPVKLVYHSLIVQPSLLIALLYGTGRQQRGSILLLAWALSLAITLAVFTFVPAMGAPPYFLDYMDVLTGARDGTLTVLGTKALNGIVTFPSFHAAAAVLLGWGFAPIKRIGPVLVVLNVLMGASALFASHYLVDLIAGALIGGASIWIAARIHAWVTDARNLECDGLAAVEPVGAAELPGVVGVG